MNKLLKIGSIVNPLPRTYTASKAISKSCTVTVPSRVDTFLCKTQYFVNPPRQQVYPVGSINFVVNQYSTASVEVNALGSPSIIYSKREKIISHVYQMLKKVLNFNDELTIKADNQHNIIHGGLGSSVSLKSATAIAINELYGRPLSSTELITFLSQNYGEENENDNTLNPAASIGGGVASSVLPGNINIMQCDTGEPLYFNLPSHYKIVTLFPEMHEVMAGFDDYKLTINGHSRFKSMGKEYGETRKKVLSETIIPSLKNGEYSELFFHINKYTMGYYGNIPEYFSNRWAGSGLRFEELVIFLHDRLFNIFTDKECCFFVSSGGPLISIVTPDADKTVQALQGLSGKISVLDLHGTAATVELHKD